MTLAFIKKALDIKEPHTNASNTIENIKLVLRQKAKNSIIMDGSYQFCVIFKHIKCMTKCTSVITNIGLYDRKPDDYLPSQDYYVFIGTKLKFATRICRFSFKFTIISHNNKFD